LPLAAIACQSIVMEPLTKSQWSVVAQLVALWRGELPLSQAFWEYAIVYGTIANIVATAAAIAAVAAGLPDAVGIGLFLSPVPYILTAVVGVMRSASRYQGTPVWAGLAKIAVIVWGAIMIFI
jgi:hypothetical protein